MDACNRFDGFNFNHNLAAYEKVKPIAAFQLQVSIDKRDWFLALKRDFAERKFAGEAFFVDSFEEARPQPAVDLYSRPDYRARYVTVIYTHE